MNAAVRKWLPALAPGLVLVLLAVQLLLGFRGFGHPHGGLLGALEIPGRLLGWGGVVLLLPLLAWLLVGWWGFGVTGMALKMLGAVTLGLAVGGLAGLAGGEAAGGRIGAAIAVLLSDALGPVVATLLLLVMAAPGFLLAAARFQVTRPVMASPDLRATETAPEAETLRGEPPPAFVPPGRSPPPRDLTPPSIPVAATKSRGWYPERRFDAQGNELPMDFGSAKDVGAVRYRDEPAPSAPATAAPVARAHETPEPPVARHEPAPPRGPLAAPMAPTEPVWPKGLREVPDDDDARAAPAPAAPERPRISVPSAADRLRPQAARPRPVPQPPPEPGAPSEPAPPHAPESEGPPARVFTRSLFPKNPGDPVRLPGVRYRDEELAAAALQSSAGGPGAPPQSSAPAPVEPPPPPPSQGPPRESLVAPVPKKEPRSAAAPKSRAASPPSPPPEPPATLTPAPPPPAAVREPRANTKPAPVSRKAEDAAPRSGSASAPFGSASAPLSGSADDARYQSQLAASGIFDAAPPAPAPKPTKSSRAPAPATVDEPEILPPVPGARAPEPLRAVAGAGAPEPLRAVAGAGAPEPLHPEPPTKKGARRTAAASAPPAAPAVKAPAAREAAPKSAPEKAAPAKPQVPKAPPPAPAKPKPAWVQELADDIFLKAVEASLERGAASAVLLTRKLGIGYGKAQALVDRLAQSGVLGEVTPNGARPVLIRREDFDAAR